MKRIPHNLLRLPSMLAHVLGIPLFLLFFVLIYLPEWMINLLNMDADRWIFNLLMVTCIVLGVLCASRIPITCVRSNLRGFSWLRYTLLCVGEVILMSVFVALYLTVSRNALLGGVVTSYFTTLGWSAAMVGSIVIFPYLLLNFVFAILERHEQQQSEDELIRLHDNAQQLKLVVASSAVVYIEADANYLIIKYTEGERLKEYQLRNSMKSLEPQLHKHGIIRCQRSFFVNPKHVTALRKDKEGLIIAELDIKNARTIPVSPNYYDNLSRLL